MQSLKGAKIAMLMGGCSDERTVSLSSGRECSRALQGLGYHVNEIDACGVDLPQQLSELAPDIVFNALHGRWGEDGVVQGILEWLAIAYTHSGVAASALAMDKIKAKAVFRAAGLRVPDHKFVSKKDVQMGAHFFDYPYVIKPINQGSSIGVCLITELGRPLHDCVPDLSDLPDALMVEPFITGHELTVSVLGGDALGVTEIVTDGWYDYHAKYTENASRHIFPADIPADIAQAACEYARRAHEALGCRGLTRSDFRWMPEHGRDGLFLLEINTQPGMTPTSLSPEQAAFNGLDFAALCEWILKDASCNR